MKNSLLFIGGFLLTICVPISFYLWLRDLSIKELDILVTVGGMLCIGIFGTIGGMIIKETLNEI